MQYGVLNNLAKNVPENESADLNAPFSYLEWKNYMPLIIEETSFEQYNLYLQQWFSRRKQVGLSNKFILRQKFLYLLDQLQLFFTDKEKNKWYAQINLSDEKELLLAIPYFAKKLKDISLYYLKLRKKLKHTKRKYNVVGTSEGLKQEVRTYFLETFSQDNLDLDPDFSKNLPTFSELQQNLNVQIQELYDDKQYFDLSPTKPVSAYFDLFHAATQDFFATKGIVLSSSEWLFETFNVPLTSNLDAYVAQLTSNIFEQTDANLYGNFIQKYLAENKNLVGFSTLTSSSVDYNVALQEGNNFFYYPYGKIDTSVSIDNRLTPVALSSITIQNATAGATIKTSDTIFVRNGEDIKAAWLRYVDFQNEQKAIKTTVIKDSITSFIFPYPGYGLSGDSFEWTGREIETTSGYEFLPKDVKTTVNASYWSEPLPVNDSCNSILLNNSSLVSSCGATASINPALADQVFINVDKSIFGGDATMADGELSGAWLYKHTRTSIPISPIQPNVIHWPFDIVVDPTEALPSYLAKISYEKFCSPISIQDFNTSYSIAASSITLADRIFKLHDYGDETDVALECAWLSSAKVTLSGYSFFNQTGFNIKCPPGEAVRFVWNGEETALDTVFKSTAHDKDCPFATQALSGYSQWQECTCKQVYYNPFGHPGNRFKDNNSFADFIAEDVENALQPFDLGSWRDSTRHTYGNSIEFAWFKTYKNHGWGGGRWVAGTTNGKVAFVPPFTLKPGKAYFYKRAANRTPANSMPLYNVNYDFVDFFEDGVVWAEAKINIDGSWSSTGKRSQMVIYPGDFIKYSRQAQTTCYLASASFEENTSSNINGNIWSTYDTIAINGSQGSTVLSYPVKSKPFNSLDSQYPLTDITGLTSIKGWSVTNNETDETQTIYLPVVTFIPPVSGTYSVSVTAVVGAAKVIHNNIPQITAIPQYRDTITESKFSYPSSGFLMEQSLGGWNYNRCRYELRSTQGARPYWAELYSNKTPATKYKGIYSWGYPNEYVDDYLPKNTPIMSPLEIQYGSTISYNHKGPRFIWNQPVTYQTYVGSTQWCQITSDDSSASVLSAFFVSKKYTPNLNVIPTTNPTDIILTNKLNGRPVEVFYYALNSFSWPITAEIASTTDNYALTSTYFEAKSPWTTLTNRFYPTVAVVPVLEETYSWEDMGGYFLPQNLGASQFINKNFTSFLSATHLSAEILAEDTNIHIGGRGRTKQDQETFYDWDENNLWMKESANTGELAGSVKAELTKTLQTFVPYQSNIEETELGLVTNKSRITPWGGPFDDQWTDVKNNPQSFTGIKNVSAWSASQVLKQTEKITDCWVSDIYGNQYGLFKELSAVPVSNRIDVDGEIWARTNDQVVSPGYMALSSVYNQYKHNYTVYGDLTGNKIKSVDCFFDRLFIETNNIVTFTELEYNFDNNSIESVYDNTREVLLNSKLRFEANWFFPSEKKVISLFTAISANHPIEGDPYNLGFGYLNSIFVPTLMEYNLTKRTLEVVFPVTAEDKQNLIESLASLSATNLSRALLTYNETLNCFLLTYKGLSQGKMFVADFTIMNDV